MMLKVGCRDVISSKKDCRLMMIWSDRFSDRVPETLNRQKEPFKEITSIKKSPQRRFFERRPKLGIRRVTFQLCVVKARSPFCAIPPKLLSRVRSKKPFGYKDETRQLRKKSEQANLELPATCFIELLLLHPSVMLMPRASSDT